MKIICERSELRAGINRVIKAVPVRTTMSILECILIDASSGVIKLTGNDMELCIETRVEGDILETGSIAVGARFFSDIVSKLADGDITISSDDSMKVEISCGNAKFHIIGKPAIDFTGLPNVEKTDSYTISEFALKEVIKQTIFAISANESNPIMSGELFDFDSERLRVIALDGQRIAIRNVALKKSSSAVKVIVPGKTMNELGKILEDEAEKDVEIFITDKHILFEFGKTSVVSRLIEGEYFKVDRMISSDYNTKVELNKKEFNECIDRASLLVSEKDRTPIIATVSDEKIELKSQSHSGSMVDSVSVVKEGSDLVIGFNPKLVTDAIRVIDDEMITIYFVSSKTPFVIRNEEQTYTYLILPINF